MNYADAIQLAACVYVAGAVISALGGGIAMLTGNLHIDRDLGLLPAPLIALLAVVLWPVAFVCLLEDL